MTEDALLRRPDLEGTDRPSDMLSLPDPDAYGQVRQGVARRGQRLVLSSSLLLSSLELSDTNVYEP